MIHTIKDVEINKGVPLFTPISTEGYENKPVLVGVVSTETNCSCSSEGALKRGLLDGNCDLLLIACPA